VVQKSNARSNSSSPRRRRRRDARRDELLRAAARMFRDRGVADTGMRDIAEAADLSPANLYHYFRGKDEILFYCQDRALDRMLDTVAAAKRRRAPVADRLHEILSAHLKTMLNEIEGATAHLHVDALSPVLRARFVRKRDRYEHALRAVVADGVRRGELVAGDPALVARAMLGAMNWTVTWFNPAGPRTGLEVGDTIAAFLVRGVAARGTAHPRRLKLVPQRRG
jgi:AcrR family transcriptional regulator